MSMVWSIAQPPSGAPWERGGDPVQKMSHGPPLPGNPPTGVAMKKLLLTPPLVILVLFLLWYWLLNREEG